MQHLWRGVSVTFNDCEDVIQIPTAVAHCIGTFASWWSSWVT